MLSKLCIKNPYNKERTCGGSSGGEGAILALKASPLGYGNSAIQSNFTVPFNVSHN